MPACLDAVHAQTYPNLELVVIDNASDDDSLSIVETSAPKASVIPSDVNRGYGAAHNRGIDAAKGEYYLALNPDVVLAPDYVAALVGALEEHPQCGSAMGKLWLPGRETQGKKLLDGTGLFIDRQRHQALRGHGEWDEGQYDTPEEVFGADGAAPLYRKTALADLSIGSEVFDEAFFAYMEDVDLSWRARLLGWKTWYEPQATGYHDRTFRPGSRRPIPRPMRRHAVKNRYLTICKNEAPETWRRDWWRILAYDVRILGYMLVAEQTSLGAYAMLMADRHRMRTWRREIWSRVRTTPEERRTWFA